MLCFGAGGLVAKGIEQLNEQLDMWRWWLRAAFPKEYQMLDGNLWVLVGRGSLDQPKLLDEKAVENQYSRRIQKRVVM